MKRLKKNIHQVKVGFVTEVSSHKNLYLFLSLILLVALFVRSYRLNVLLGFFYDQGRDALVIWDLWHKGDPFLVGPVTGLEGIYLGPFYYYMIALFYLIGGGNPAIPAYFVSFLAASGIIIVYYLGWKMHSRAAGIISMLVSGFSYYLVLAGRWLSNPTPIFLTSMIYLLSLWKITQSSKSKTSSDDKSFSVGWWWVLAVAAISVSMHFESASAIFYFPVLAVFAYWQKDKLPKKLYWVISLMVFVLSVLPQVLFNFLKDNVLLDSFRRVIFGQNSFRVSFWQVLGDRLDYFWTVFSSKIFPEWYTEAKIFALVSLVGIVFIILGAKRAKDPKKEDIKNISKQVQHKYKTYTAIKLLIIFIGVPMIGYIFFQGNYGNIYDYYMTGYYYPMMLLFSLGIAELWRNKVGRLIVIIFFALFFYRNGILTRYYIIAGYDGPEHISLGNELQAVDWVYEDAKVQCHSELVSEFEESDEILNQVQDDNDNENSEEILSQAMPSGRQVQDDGPSTDIEEIPDQIQDDNCQFNVDVYVPPVIPHTYDYLFLWQGNKRCGNDLCGLTEDEQVETLYTLYEVDPPHPERLEFWLERQAGIGEVIKEESFGGITVQRRKRICWGDSC